MAENLVRTSDHMPQIQLQQAVVRPWRELEEQDRRGPIGFCPGFLSSFNMRNVCLKKKKKWPLTEIRMWAGFEARGDTERKQVPTFQPQPTPLFDQSSIACEGVRGGDRKTEGLRTPHHRKGLGPPRLVLSC